uniref:Uncharacterized protein n=1 Tax=Globodera rostochiensis TaxID=31243 RepID=A0A914IA50_GLORO
MERSVGLAAGVTKRGLRPNVSEDDEDDVQCSSPSQEAVINSAIHSLTHPTTSCCFSVEPNPPNPPGVASVDVVVHPSSVVHRRCVVPASPPVPFFHCHWASQSNGKEIREDDTTHKQHNTTNDGLHQPKKRNQKIG